MKTVEYLTTAELAKLLGVSRVTVFGRIKKGEIKSVRIGRNNLIAKEEVDRVLSESTPDKVVKRVVEEYGETLRLLGKE